MSWFQDWFDEYYLDLYRNRDPQDAQEQSKLIIKTLTKYSATLQEQSWLDIGCGMGRYVNIFQRQGFHIRGIDISATLIAEGKKTYPHIDIAHKTITDCISESARYGILLSLFTSFGYYEQDRENFAMLKDIVALGDSGSKFYLWMDFLNAEQLLNIPLNDDVIKSPQKNVYEQKRRVIHHNGLARIEKTIRIFDPEGKYLKTYKESVRLFTLSDFEAMFQNLEMKILSVFGDYQGNPYGPTSPRLIMLVENNA